jgi:hypothetical protein
MLPGSRLLSALMRLFAFMILCPFIGMLLYSKRTRWVWKPLALALLFAIAIPARRKCWMVGQDEYCTARGTWLERYSEIPGDCTQTRPESVGWGGNNSKINHKTSTRSGNSTIAILVVNGDLAHATKYQANVHSLKCYSQIHGYAFGLHNISQACTIVTHRFFFARHCVVGEQMVAHPEVEWFLVLDADNAVVSPHLRLEKFIDNSKDIIHFLRFHNNEVSASSYMVRNTAYGRDYVAAWVGLNDDAKATHSYSGMNHDNGALHWLLLHKLACSTTSGWSTCIQKGQAGKDYWAFVRCFHNTLANSKCQGMDWSRIGIIGHGKAWAYDGWVTRYAWNRNATLIHHAMKNPPMCVFRFCCCV